MLKKILTLVLCLTLTLSALAGCSLVNKNDEKNSLRVIATIDPISDSGDDKHTLNKFGYYEYYLSDNYLNLPENQDSPYKDSNDANPTVFYEKGGFFFIDDINGEEGDYVEVYNISLADLKPKTESWSIETEQKKIYKYQLFAYINNYGADYMNNYGYTAERMVNEFVDMLVSREVGLVEAERFIAKGEIVLDQAFENTVAKAIYSQIDSQYNTLLNNIRKEHGIETFSPSSESPSAETTYPLYPHSDEIIEDDEAAWDIANPKNAARWPGMVGTAQSKSRELEAMARLVRGFEDIVKDDFRLSGQERKDVEASIDEIHRVINTQGMQAVYPMLGKTALVDYLIGKSTRDDEILKLLQDYIDGDIDPTDDEILREYNRLRRTQEATYAEDISKYHAASGEKLIFVNPDPLKHIYVKHILIQFTEDQKALLEAYKKNPTTASDTEAYKQYRANLAAEIIGYEHVDGEDDLSSPLTINQISNIIRSQMAAVNASQRDSERTFERLIYRYNQDPGMFDSALGYAVINELEGEETDTYVEEFSEGARKLRNDENPDGSKKYQIGDMLDYNIVSDFGVHFMYYSYQRPTSEVSIHDYVTVGEYETYYDLLKESVKANKSNNIFSEWSNAIVYDYKEETGVLTVFEKRYSDIYK